MTRYVIEPQCDISEYDHDSTWFVACPPEQAETWALINTETEEIEDDFDTQAEAEAALLGLLPVAVTLEHPELGEIQLLDRFATIDEAEDYLATCAGIDPDWLERGLHGIDAPEEMVNP